MKHTSILPVILFGLCAGIWSVRTVLDIVNNTYADSFFSLAGNVFCSVVWTVQFVIALKRFLSDK